MESFAKSCGRLNDMVGRACDKNGLGIQAMDKGSGEADTGCGVAACGFADNLVWAQFGQLFEGAADMVLCGDDQQIAG